LHFHEHLTDAQPDVTIRLRIVSPGTIASAPPESESRYAFSGDTTVNFGPNLLEGRWDFENRQFNVQISRDLMVQEELWLFDRFLCRVYYTLVMHDAGRRADPFIVHSAGVVRDGRGYVFFGPPESGKSTAARLSQTFSVLHDDMNIVTMQNGAVTVAGAPFNPKLIERTNTRAPLSMICSLHKSDRTCLERSTPDEFLQKIVPEIFLPLPLFSDDRKSAFAYILRCLTSLSAQVPCYRLYFEKNTDFWDCISTQEVPHGKHSRVFYTKKRGKCGVDKTG
jgi:hypothetical protein